MGMLGDSYKIKTEKYNLNRAIIIDNEREFVMSLCKLPNITILESKNRDNLIKAKEKEKYKGNYIVINNYVSQGN